MIIRTIDYIYENLINNNSKRHCCSIAAATTDADAAVGIDQPFIIKMVFDVPQS